MNCPKCDLKLTEGTYEGVQTFLCEGCTGILFKQTNLITIVNRMSLDLFSSIGINSILPETPDKLEKIKCPDCKRLMEQYGYMGSKKVTMDNCISCNYIWLDANELSAIVKMYVQLEKNKEHLRHLFKGSEASLVSTHVNSNSLSQIFLLGFVVSAGLKLADSIFND